jgi:hypothetical protein
MAIDLKLVKELRILKADLHSKSGGSIWASLSVNAVFEKLEG